MKSKTAEGQVTFLFMFLLLTINFFPVETYLFGQSTAQFTEQTNISLPGVAQSSVSWCDYDNDGDLDILLTGHSFNGDIISKIFMNNGDGTLTEQTTILFTGAGYSSAAWGDYDNDGDLDVIIIGTADWFGEDASSKIYKNNGNGTFMEISSVNLPGVQSGSCEWGDYDNDGDLDILITGYSVTGVVSNVFKNNGNNNFTEDFSVSLENVYYGSASWGDYDNDGDLDILLTGNNVTSPVSKIYKNNGDGSFSEETSINLTSLWQSSVSWCDYDNDGDLDILVTGDAGDQSYVSKIYKNNGNGTFTDQTLVSLPGVADGSSAWGDYDNDGWPDILLTGTSNSGPISKIFRNNKGESFTEETSILLKGVQRSSAAWGDYDNDGDLDLLVTGSTGSDYISTIYKNNSTTANTPPDAPSGLLSNVIGNYVALSWNKSTDAQTPQGGLNYNLVISSVPGGTNVLSPMASRLNGFRRVVRQGSLKTTNWPVNGLPDGTYYWSVQSIDAAFAGSQFAAENTFTVSTASPAIPVPILAYPTGGVTLYTNSPVLAWQINQNISGLNYNLQMSESSNFADLILNADNIDALNYEASGLNGGKTYYWKVRAKSSAGEYGEFSSTGSFKVNIQGGNEPPVPVLSYPTGGMTVYTSSPVVTWYISQWMPALKYQLQLSLTDDFTSPVIDVTLIDGFVYQLQGLSAGVTYFTRVRSFTPEGNYSDYSSLGSFRVDGGNGTQAVIPAIAYPAGGITVYTAFPIITWYITQYAPGEKYNLQVSSKADFSSLILNQDDISSIQYQLSGLTPGATYYVRVRGKAPDGTYSLYSSVGSFSVYAGSSPVVPVAASPSGGVKIAGSSAILSWYFPTVNSVKLNYDIQISDKEDFSNAVLIKDIDSSSYMIDNLQGEKYYYWRVRSKTLDNKTSEYSNEGTFITAKLTNAALRRDNQIPKEYELKQNYPNPFNSTSAIEFSVPKSEWVRLQVFDMLGREAEELVNQHLDAGNYKFLFHSHDLSSGVYIYKLSTSTVNIIHKMILQK